MVALGSKMKSAQIDNYCASSPTEPIHQAAAALMRRVILPLVGVILTVTAAFAADSILPDPKLTPGAILTTDEATICQPGYSRSVRHTSGALSVLSATIAGSPRPWHTYRSWPHLVRCHGQDHHSP